jgi:O-antigen ligase
MKSSDENKTAPTRPAERAFLRLYLIMLGACFYFAFFDITHIDTLEKAGNSSVYRGIWVILYFGLLYFSLSSYRLLARGLIAPVLLLLISLTAYAFNGFEAESVVKLGMYMFTMLFGIWLAARFSFQEFFSIYYRLASYVSAAHLLLYPAVNHISHKFEPLARANIFDLSIYSGLFAHKNQAGLFFGIAFVIGFIRLFFTDQPRTVGACLLLGAIFFSLGMTGAASPLISAIFACAGIIAIEIVRRYGKAGIGVMMIFVPLPAIIVLNAEWFLGLFGRDLSLTGRSYAYQSWFLFFQQHPLFGYGYGEFFSSSSDAPGIELNAGKLYAHFMNFESGVLQTGIDFGAAGMIVMGAIVVYALANGIKYSQRRGVAGYFPVGIMIFIITSTLNEVYIVAFNTLTPAIVFYIYFRFRLLAASPAVYDSSSCSSQPHTR